MKPYYSTTPNIESEAFRLLVIFDTKPSTAEVATVEAEVDAGITQMESDSGRIDTKIGDLERLIMRLRVAMRNKGIL